VRHQCFRLLTPLAINGDCVWLIQPSYPLHPPEEGCCARDFAGFADPPAFVARERLLPGDHWLLAFGPFRTLTTLVPVRSLCCQLGALSLQSHQFP